MFNWHNLSTLNRVLNKFIDIYDPQVNRRKHDLFAYAILSQLPIDHDMWHKGLAYLLELADSSAGLRFETGDDDFGWNLTHLPEGFYDFMIALDEGEEILSEDEDQQGAITCCFSILIDFLTYGLMSFSISTEERLGAISFAFDHILPLGGIFPLFRHYAAEIADTENIKISTAHKTARLLQLAQSFYDDQYFDELYVLADILEENKYQNVQLLEHLRSPGPHVRGCWALDKILGLE